MMEKEKEESNDKYIARQRLMAKDKKGIIDYYFEKRMSFLKIILVIYLLLSVSAIAAAYFGGEYYAVRDERDQQEELYDLVNEHLCQEKFNETSFNMLYTKDMNKLRIICSEHSFTLERVE